MKRDVSRVSIFDRWDSQKAGIEFDMDTPEGQANLDLAISQLKPDIVFFDSFFDFHNSDENKADHMKPIMFFLNGIAEKHGAAIALSHHNRKRKSAEQKLEVSQDDMIGSSMLHKNAAVILLLQSRTITDSYGATVSDAVMVKCEKSWTKKPKPFAFRIEDEDDDYHTSMRIILNPDIGGTKQEQIIEIIEESFDVGAWFSRKEIIELCGKNAGTRTIDIALEEMLLKGFIEANGEGSRNKKYARVK
jgi:hypothetical protein